MKWSYGVFVILTTTVCLGMNPPRLAAADWNWVDATPGNTPFDAVVGGSEGNGDHLYICRANYGGAIHPGKFRPGFQGCNIGWEGNEVSVPKFQILVPSWTSASNSSVPPEASAFGREADGLPLFVCRANYQGGLHPGKVRPGLGGCDIGYGGKEIFLPNYEVLTTLLGDVFPGLPDTEALVGGREDGQNLYVCLGDYNGGTHPGKFRPGFDACNIAWGGAEVKDKFQWTLLIPYWKRSPINESLSFFFRAGNEPDGTPFYICRFQAFHASGSGVHPGKFRVGFAGCHITWAGREYEESQSYEVLGLFHRH